MKILFTGASSFTGYWFVKELAQAGHEVTAIFRGSDSSYEGLRNKRIDLLKPFCERVFCCEFGSEKFLQCILAESRWDVFCHHAADVTNYRSPQFDIATALANNTRNLDHVLELLVQKNCQKLILTGSIFEPNEGQGTDHLRAFSPYGVSKGLTAEVFKYYTQQRGIKLGKFVIPNPFGPFEDPRFTSYLLNHWLNGEKPSVNTPEYIRDNIHVSLLAKMYVYFAENLSQEFEKINPSGYVGTQKNFVSLLADEIAKRLNLSCPVIYANQTHFPEPRARFNTDSLNRYPLNWNEETAWQEFVDYYQNQLLVK